MATLISRVTGNLTAAGTWGTVDATSLLDSEAASTASTTSQVNSSNFTPGVITCDGCAIKLNARVASPTGTFTLTLRNTTAGSNLTATTVNVADMPASGNGWQFIKWGSSQVLLGATNYAIGIQTSVTGEVTLYRDGTAGNWSRLLSTTTTAAPAANDLLHICGELTGAGTGNDVTVTMDDTSATSYGTTTPPQAITINNRGILTNGTTASTAYTFKYKGVFKVNGGVTGGTLNIGTSGTRIPSTSTATYTAASAANVDSGWNFANGSTINIYGATKTTLATLMTADKVATNTVITLASTSGWAASDSLAFTSTSRTASEAEKKVVLTVDSGTQVTLTAGLTNNHSGTSPTQAEVINLTRNVLLTGVSDSLQGYILVANTATVNVDYAEFNNLGSGTANKNGIDIQTTTGASSFTNCSLHDFAVSGSRGFYISGVSSNNFTISTNVGYRLSLGAIRVEALTSGSPTYTISGNTFIRSLEGSDGFLAFADLQGTITNNTAASSALDGINMPTGVPKKVGTFSGNTSHSNNRYGMYIGSLGGTSTFGYATLSNTTLWRNSDKGFAMNVNIVDQLTIDGLTAFGNISYNVFLGQGSNGVMSRLILKNLTLNGDTTFSTAIGISFAGNAAYDVSLFNSNLGTASGIKTAHTIDIDTTQNSNTYIRILGSNVTLASATPVSMDATGSNAHVGSIIGINKLGGTVGNHRSWACEGGTKTDTTAGLFRTASPSERLTPQISGVKLKSGLIYIPITSGTTTATVSAYVRKSVVGDGAAYNGVQARLIVLENDGAGANYTSDIVVATSTAASDGAFELLTGTLPAPTDDAILVAYVDCDGTAGWINISDVTTVTTATTLGNPKYFSNGKMTVLSGTAGTAAGGGGGSWRLLRGNPSGH